VSPIEVYSTGDLRQPALEQFAEATKVDISAALHISATRSLTSQFQSVSLNSHTIADLTNLYIESTFTPASRPPSRAEDLKGRREALLARSRARKLDAALKFDRFLRIQTQPYENRELASLMTTNRRVIYRTLQSLSSSGFRAETISGDLNELQQAVRTIWRECETELPEFLANYNALWRPLREDAFAGTTEALDAAVSILGCDHSVIVFHGFHFYTPAQYALFKLAERYMEHRLVFFVHDDGERAVFEEWRRFFSGRWLPAPTPIPPSGEVTVESAASRQFENAMSGKLVNADGAVDYLEVVEFSEASVLVRELAHERLLVAQTGSNVPMVFAAQSDSLERLRGRLEISLLSRKVQIAHLPVGAFLVELHRCLQLPNGQPGAYLSFSSLQELTGTGVVAHLGVETGRQVQANFEYAASFFDGCSSESDWARAMEALESCIAEEIIPGLPLHAKTSDLTITGDERILIPWLSLTPDELAQMKSVVSNTFSILNQILESGNQKVRSYARFLHRQVEEALKGLDYAYSNQLNEMLMSFGLIEDLELTVEGLVDLVVISMGRRLDFDDFPSEVEDEDELQPLQSLDQFAYKTSEVDIHLMNLSDAAFPSMVKTVGWPFSLMHVEAKTMLESQSVALLHAREEFSGLGDLYLFSLALMCAGPSSRLTLSWIRNFDDYSMSPSPLIRSLTAAQANLPFFTNETGGYAITHSGLGGDDLSADVPSPEIDETDPTVVVQVIDAIMRLPNELVASSIPCTRRLFLQWANLRRAGFRDRFRQTHLYGNFIGLLEKKYEIDHEKSVSFCNRAWFKWPMSEKLTSRGPDARIFVGKRGKWPSARPAWIYLMAGKADGTRPVDAAYRVLIGKAGTEETKVELLRASSPRRAGPLPAGVVGDHCNLCPVQTLCARRRAEGETEDTD